jgi:hypothetical protein
VLDGLGSCAPEGADPDLCAPEPCDPEFPGCVPGPDPLEFVGDPLALGVGAELMGGPPLPLFDAPGLFKSGGLSISSGCAAGDCTGADTFSGASLSMGRQVPAAIQLFLRSRASVMVNRPCETPAFSPS